MHLSPAMNLSGLLQMKFMWFYRFNDLPEIEGKPARLRENHCFVGESSVQQLRRSYIKLYSVDLQICSSVKAVEQRDISKCRRGGQS